MSTNNENSDISNGTLANFKRAFSNLKAGAAAQKAASGNPPEEVSSKSNGAEPHINGAGTSEHEAGDDNPSAQAAPISIPFTLIESLGKPFCKSYFYNSAGVVDKRVGARIHEGKVRCFERGSLRAVMAVVQAVKDRKRHDIAAVWGKVRGAKDGDQFPLGLKGKCINGAIPRSNEDFGWPEGPAIAACDYDPYGEHRFDWRELDERFCKIVPELEPVTRCWFPSSSAFIRDRDGNLVKQAAGWRMYVALDDGRRIEDFLFLLLQGSWTLGLDHIRISNNGRARVAGLVDVQMRIPIQPDFIAPAKLGEWLAYDYPEVFPQWRGTEPLLPTEALPKPIPMKDWLRTAAVKQRFEASKEACGKQAEKWLKEDRLPKLRKLHPDKSDEELLAMGRRQLAQTGTTVQLDPDWIIHFSEDETKTVREIWSDPSYEDRMCCDPLEPDHHDYELNTYIHIAPKGKSGPCGVSLNRGVTTTYRVDKLREGGSRTGRGIPGRVIRGGSLGKMDGQVFG